MIIKSVFILLITSIFLLLNLGGLVHNTGSSLACPDWPLCYGQFFPKMEGGVLIEHSHRLLASFVGFLNIILCILFFKTGKDNKEYFRSSLVLLFLVIFQGVLGGITVIYKLPTIVSTLHLATSMIYFCGVIALAIKWFMKDAVYDSSASKEIKQLFAKLRDSALLLTFIVYSQMILGAFLRHSGAGAACGLGWENSLLCLNQKSWALEFWPSLLPAKIHMVHRIVGISIFFISIAVLAYEKFQIKSIRKELLNSKIIKNHNLVSILVFITLMVQLFLGFATVGNHIGVSVTTLHLGFAAILLVLNWYRFFTIYSFEKKFFAGNQPTVFTDLVSLLKPKLSALVMLTTFVGMITAPSPTGSQINFFSGLLIIINISFVVMGACALNCYLEKDVDKKMERTKNRPLPTGRLQPKHAFQLGVSLVAIGTLYLITQVNFLTGFLAILAAVLYLFAYTPMKLKGPSALYLGAIPGALPPILGRISVTGEFDSMSYFLFALLFIWQIPHFLAIAIYHFDDYKNAEIKTIPGMRGEKTTLVQIVIYSLGLMLISPLPYYLGQASIIYRNFALVLGLGIFLFSILPFTKKFSTSTNTQIWAKQYFYGTLLYLPGLLGCILFFK